MIAKRGRAVVVGSDNALGSTSLVQDFLAAGADPADAVVQGVQVVELDPSDNSVGYGGLPNEEGVVELDASVMHGPTHKAGGVAALRNIKTPAAVALLVLRRTDHVLLVGEGALRFAKAHGFKEEDLLTEESRRAWTKWRENRDPEDDWLDEAQRDPVKGEPIGRGGEPIPWTTGTVHLAAVDAAGDIAACTSTSGLSYKIAGRVGDSPIVGAGMYVENDVGAAGATGRGEACLVNCGAFDVVREMERGLTPAEACLRVLERVARRTREKRLLDAQGRPNFGLTFYALRKDGEHGSASLKRGPSYAVHDGTGARRLACAWVYE